MRCFFMKRGSKDNGVDGMCEKEIIINGIKVKANVPDSFLVEEEN